MPPPPSQKGTGKKGGRSSDARRSRSRNTTPAISNETDSTWSDVPLKPLRSASYDEIIDTQGTGSSTIPDSKSVEKHMNNISSMNQQLDQRDDDACAAVRKIYAKKKDRMQEDTENEVARREKSQREAEEQERARKANKKKKNDAGKAERQTNFSHGVHGMAAQDGSNSGKLFRNFPYRTTPYFSFVNHIPLWRQGLCFPGVSTRTIVQDRIPAAGLAFTGRRKFDIARIYETWYWNGVLKSVVVLDN